MGVAMNRLVLRLAVGFETHESPQAAEIGLGGEAEDEGLGAGEPFEPLPFVSKRSDEMAEALELLGYGLANAPDSRDGNALENAIREIVAGEGIVVVYFIGHGGVGSLTSRYYLAGNDATPETLTACGVDICGILDRVNGRPDGPIVLFLLDACQSGRAVRHVMGQDQHDDERRAWVFAAAHPTEPAWTGRFSAALTSVLRGIAAGKVDIDASEKFVNLDLVQKLVQTELDRDTSGMRQMAELSRWPTPQPTPPFIPNPHLDREAALRRTARHRAIPEAAARALVDEVADPEHFRSRAFGATSRPMRLWSGVPRCVFTGRASVLEALSAWLSGSRTESGPLRVLTGSPGSGKSAVLGAIVCTSLPALRQTTPEIAARLTGSRRPPSIERMAIVHARNRTDSEIIASVGRQLGLPPDMDLDGLIDRLTGQLEFEDGAKPLVVMDALDEAQRPATVQNGVLLPLIEADAVRLLVGTRPWTDQFAPLFDAARNGPGGELGLLNLDDVDSATLEADLSDYVGELLAGSRHYEDLYDLRNGIAAVTARALTEPGRRFGSEFLAAGLFADYLDSLDIRLDNLAQVGRQVPKDLAKLLEMRLASLSANRPWLRPVLATLARAKGAGMPRSLITAAAPAYAASQLPGESDQVAAVSEAINSAIFYLRRAVDDDGTVLYRLFHQALDDRLHDYPRYPQEPAADQKDDASRLLDHLLIGLQITADHVSERAWDRAVPYLDRHAIEHAADAGRADELLADPEFLVHADAERLIPYLEAATSKPARELVTIYRTSRHVHQHLDAPARRDVLAIDATRWGLPELARRLARKPWIPQWSTGSQLSGAFRLQMTPRDGGWAQAVATAVVDGMPVAVVGSSVGYLWRADLSTGNPIGGPLTGHDEAVQAIATAMVHGAPVAVSAGRDGTVRRWDLTVGQPVGDPLSGHHGVIRGIATAVVNGHPVAVSGGDDGTLRLWDMTAGGPIGEPLTGHDAAVTAVATAVIRGRALAVSGGGDGTVRRWDLVTRTPVGDPLTGHINGVSGIATATVDGRPIIISGDGEGIVRRWDLVTGSPVGDPLIGRTKKVFGIATAVVDGRPVAVTGGLARVGCWDLAAGQQLNPPLIGHRGWVWAVTTAVVDGRPVAVSAGSDGNVRRWDLTSSSQVGDPAWRNDYHIDTLATAVVDGRWMLVSSAGHWLQRWDLATGHPIGNPLTGHDSSVEAIATIVVNGRPIAVTGGLDGTVRRWDLATGNAIGDPLVGHTSVASGVADVSAVATAVVNGHAVAITAGVATNELLIWDLASGEQLNSLRGSAWAVATIIVGGRPVAVTAYAHLQRWDLATGTKIGSPLNGDEGLVQAVATAVVDGQPIAVTGDSNGIVQRWDLAKGTPVGTPSAGHSGTIYAVTTAVTDGCPVAYSCGADGIMQRWDLVTGAPIGRPLTLPAPAGAVTVNDVGLLILAMDRDISVVQFDDWDS